MGECEVFLFVICTNGDNRIGTNEEEEDKKRKEGNLKDILY